MVRVPRETKEQAMGIASHLPGVSAGAVLAEALTLQMLIVATISEMGCAEDSLDLSAHGLLTAYTEAVISRRLDVSALSNRLAQNIEAEVEARAHALAEAAVPHHLSAALRASSWAVPSEVAEDGELTVGKPNPQHPTLN